MSRWGGFRKGRRRYRNAWSELKSASASRTETLADTPQDFAYTEAQGIWNLRSTVQFPKSNEQPPSPSSVSFVASSTSADSATIDVPTGSQAGDLVILFDSTATGSAATPTGFTTIVSDDSTFENTISYKVLDGTETTVTGHTDTQYSVKLMMTFRPNSSIANVIIGPVQNSGNTASTPAQLTVPASSYTEPTLVFGMIRAYNSTPFINETNWDTELFVEEGNGNRMKVYNLIQSTNAVQTVTASGDYGTYNHTYGFTVNVI